MDQEIQPQQDPLAIIAACEAVAYSMGANDTEAGEFNDIRERLSAGEITSQQAEELAQGVVARKQDYH